MAVLLELRGKDGGKRVNTLTIITMALAILFCFTVFFLCRLYRLEEEIDLLEKEMEMNNMAIAELLRLHPELLEEEET